jgi:tetratricopeptide (TPR) repeat protein
VAELTIDQALQQAIEAHKTGQLQEADRLYTAILNAQPEHPDANHNMGVLAVEVSKVQEALPFFKTALLANPNIAQFWLSYIDALMKLEQSTDAKAVLEQAKSNGVNGDEFDKVEQSLRDVEQETLEASRIGAKAPPQQQNVLDSLKLGQAISLAKKKCKDGSPEEAERIYQDILAKFPNNKRARDGLQGLASRPVSKASKAKDLPQHQLRSLMTLYEKGQLALVIEHAEALSKQYPKALDVWNLMGASAAQIGHLDQAILSFKRVLAVKPDSADAYYNIGKVLKQQGKLEEAILAYNNALAIKPDYAAAYYNIGNALTEQGKLEKAILAYNNVLAIKPDYADACNNMGNALTEQGKLEKAILAYNNALAIKPDYAAAYYNMGNALTKQGKLEEALASYKKALSLKADYADAAVNLVSLPVNSIDGQTISELSKKFSSICSNIDDQSQKLFFEANLLSHKGEYDKAFRIFVDANAEKLKKNKSSIGSEQKQSNAAIKRISRWSVKPQSEQKSSIKKLFILGPSRSGKSTLETFLIGSPNVHPMFESYNFEAIRKSELSMEETKKIIMKYLFYHDENSLASLGYNVVTSTNPDIIFQIDRLITMLNNSFFIFVKRNRIDIASEIFIKEYTRGHFYSYDHSSIIKYLDSYEYIWEVIKQKVPQLTIEISFDDMLADPLETIKKISQKTGASLEVSNPPNISITNLSSPFREHYASHFMVP